MVQLSKGYIRNGPVNWISWSFFRSHDQLPDHNEHMANGRNTGMFFFGIQLCPTQVTLAGLDEPGAWP